MQVYRKEHLTAWKYAEVNQRKVETRVFLAL